MLVVTLVLGLIVGYTFGAGHVIVRNKRRVSEYKQYLDKCREEHMYKYERYERY